MSYRRVRKRKRERRIIVYGSVVGRSLWSANQLPAQGVEEFKIRVYRRMTRLASDCQVSKIDVIERYLQISRDVILNK